MQRSPKPNSVLIRLAIAGLSIATFSVAAPCINPSAFAQSAPTGVPASGQGSRQNSEQDSGRAVRQSSGKSAGQNSEQSSGRASSQGSGQGSGQVVANDCPLVVLIESRTCPVCASVRPVIEEIRIAYAKKVRFLDLDVTDGKAKHDSRMIAKSHNLGSFLALYEDSYPCVGIFNRHNKCLKEIYGANPKAKYVTAIETVINAKD